MKRLIIALILVALICSVGFAKEAGETAGAASANFNYRIVSGGFWACGQDFSGGFGEFGVNLLPREKSFVLRDCIYVQGEGGYLDSQKQFSFGGLEIGDKLIFGGRVDCSGFIVRSYGFTGLAFGMFSCEGHEFVSAPFMINLNFGGGFEFQFAKRSAFALEFGGVKRFFAGGEKKVFEDFSKFTPLLTIGYRTFR